MMLPPVARLESEVMPNDSDYGVAPRPADNAKPRRPKAAGLFRLEFVVDGERFFRRRIVRPRISNSDADALELVGNDRREHRAVAQCPFHPQLTERRFVVARRVAETVFPIDPQ